MRINETSETRSSPAPGIGQSVAQQRPGTPLHEFLPSHRFDPHSHASFSFFFQHLYLSSSSVPSLGPGDLPALPHLTSLSLANTGLNTILPGAFKQVGIVIVITIIITSLSLATVPDGFEGVNLTFSPEPTYIIVPRQIIDSDCCKSKNLVFVHSSIL